MIVALIQEAVRSCDYEQIESLEDKYDQTLTLLCVNFAEYLIDGLTQEPYFLEFKLHLLEKFLPYMNGN